MLFAVSLAKKLESRGVVAFSLHPGIIFTNLTRYTSDDVLQAMGMLYPSLLLEHSTHSATYRHERRVWEAHHSHCRPMEDENPVTRLRDNLGSSS